MNSVGWDCDLSSAGIPKASGERRPMIKRPGLAPPPDGNAAPFATTWKPRGKKKARCGDLPSITGRSEKCERKLPESTVVSWGHTERSHEGIQPPLLTWLLSGQLIS